MTTCEHALYDQGYVDGLEGNEPSATNNSKYMEGYDEGCSELLEEMKELDLTGE